VERVVEKPVVIEKEKPVPVQAGVPEEVLESVKRVSETAGVLLDRISTLESRLQQYEGALASVAEAQKSISETVKMALSTMEEVRRLREEVEKLREEARKLREEKAKEQTVIPATEIIELPEQGVRKIYQYQIHPALKAIEKEVEFRTDKLGTALVEELRNTRAEISQIRAEVTSLLNRAVTLVESAIAPEVRRRAPRLVEDLESSLRRLTGRLYSPEERASKIAELRERLEREKAEEGGAG